ncbi:MAG: hypothetical protein V4793_24315 [Paraburkholderia tropica]|nr:hypothetical protein [Paraburkholderia tropica]
MAVLATNTEGAPDLCLTFFEATDLQDNEGQHYGMHWPVPETKAIGHR